jgi:hypothetical protein
MQESFVWQEVAEAPPVHGVKWPLFRELWNVPKILRVFPIDSCWNVKNVTENGQYNPNSYLDIPNDRSPSHTFSHQKWMFKICHVLPFYSRSTSTNASLSNLSISKKRSLLKFMVNLYCTSVMMLTLSLLGITASTSSKSAEFRSGPLATGMIWMSQSWNNCWKLRFLYYGQGMKICIFQESQLRTT